RRRGDRHRARDRGARAGDRDRCARRRDDRTAAREARLPRPPAARSMTALDPAFAARLLELGTAVLYEASGIDCNLDAALRPAWPGARVCGTAFPLRTGAEDNLALHLAVARAGAGDVLVADAGGLACGYWGEILAVAAQVRGVGGLVID